MRALEIDIGSARPATKSRTGLQSIVAGALAAAIYFGVAKLSLILSFAQSNTSAIWPASGLAIGELVVFGLRFWPAVTAGIFALTLTVEPFSLDKSLLITIGNTLEAVVGAALVTRFADGRDCLRRAPSVFRFILFAALLAPLLSACCGVSGIALAEPVSATSLREIFFTWYTGNVTGVLVFAPVVILWTTPRRCPARHQVVEAAVVLAILVLVGQTICGIFVSDWPSAYLVIPVLLWSALRLGRRCTVAALLVLTAIAVAGTVRGFAAFPGNSPNLSLLHLQIFLSVVSMMSLLVAGLVSELRLANESLESKVATRTLRLEEMMREKDDLMAIAAHDLQAPLAGMRSLLRLVQSRPETLSSEASGRVLHEMETTTDGMLALVSSLLVAKRAEELGRHLTVAPCDAAQLVSGMVAVHRPVAQQKGIRLHLESPANLPMSTHPESLSQIASNLLSNAIKYSPAGSTIETRLEFSPDRGTLNLEVRDEGPGISPDEVEKIFEKFRRSKNQPTSGESSHGIGLYIVDKLSQALGGRVAYVDRIGGGSCFTVTLPYRP